MYAWERLADDAEFGDWFAGPLWLLPLIRTYFEKQQLAICFVYDADVLIGVVPLAQGSHASNRCRPHWALPVNAHVRRIGVLARSAPDEVLWAAIEHLKRVPPLLLEHCAGFLQVPKGDWLDHAVRRVAQKSSLAIHTVTETRSAVIDAPDGWQRYVSTRTSEQLHPLRKRRKLQAKGAGRWEFRSCEVGGGFADAWERVLHVEGKSWKHSTGTSLLNDPGAEEFYGAVASAHAERGTLRVDLLEHEGEPVAHTLGVIHRNVYYLLKHSYDEAHRTLSPGFQLLWHSMEQRVTEGCVRLDLLGDEMPWKSAVATSLPQYVSHLLFSPASLSCQWCRLSEQVIKPFARAAGVKRILGRIRRS